MVICQHPTRFKAFLMTKTVNSSLNHWTYRMLFGKHSMHTHIFLSVHMFVCVCVFRSSEKFFKEQKKSHFRWHMKETLIIHALKLLFKPEFMKVQNLKAGSSPQNISSNIIYPSKSGKLDVKTSFRFTFKFSCNKYTKIQIKN